MATLIIHAPQNKAEHEGKRSFAETIKQRIGEGYAIPQAKANKLKGQGHKVIVLDKDEERRAEGRLVKLRENGDKAGNGMKRYDVYMAANLREVKPYKSEPLGRTGVSVVE